MNAAKAQSQPANLSVHIAQAGAQFPLLGQP